LHLTGRKLPFGLPSVDETFHPTGKAD
jgi:hypothetical protein